MKKQWVVVLIGLLLASLLLSACGAGNPTGKTQLPAFSKATADSGALEAFRQAMLESEQKSFADSSVEFKAYTTDASLDEVKAFYDGVLKDWSYLGKTEQNTISLLKYGLGQYKAVAIFWGPNPVGSGNMLFVEQVWK